MPWNGGYNGNIVSLPPDNYQGSEAGGWQRFLIDTGFNIPGNLAHKGIYGARISPISASFAGGGPAPGQFAQNWEYDAQVSFSQAFYVNGAAADASSDPMGRSFNVRAYIFLRLRPSMVNDGFSSVDMNSFSWALYRLT
jgi:hypothetical protein